MHSPRPKFIISWKDLDEKMIWSWQPTISSKINGSGDLQPETQFLQFITRILMKAWYFSFFFSIHFRKKTTGQYMFWNKSIWKQSKFRFLNGTKSYQPHSWIDQTPPVPTAHWKNMLTLQCFLKVCWRKMLTLITSWKLLEENADTTILFGSFRRISISI